ncbi:putative E3 ubiquitin-protein ligase XBAT35 isoform X2 [Castanea sativa]|uniref:putative E3 ubiquitin-protein ligase XBAT35 isoform X2 n=1 Tax=Castanea sativa TaxID=21020 RepID=UPI003F64984A
MEVARQHHLWIDREGKTPLIVACMNHELFDTAKTLIELGANVNAYSPGRHAGTPLHHAAKRGLEQSVKLLLSHGANALVRNDDCHTPLDVARVKGQTNVVRTIEVPPELDSKASTAINKGRIYISKTSPQNVLDLYLYNNH